jgi:hypothetical protein
VVRLRLLLLCGQLLLLCGAMLPPALQFRGCVLGGGASWRAESDAGQRTSNHGKQRVMRRRMRCIRAGAETSSRGACCCHLMSLLEINASYSSDLAESKNITLVVPARAGLERGSNVRAQQTDSRYICPLPSDQPRRTLSRRHRLGCCPPIEPHCLPAHPSIRSHPASALTSRRARPRPERQPHTHQDASTSRRA